MAGNLVTPNAFPKYLQENRNLPRYDSSVEDKYPHPWWKIDQAGFQGLLKEMSAVVADTMTGIPDGDSELKHLKAVADALPQVQRSPAVKVAMLGSQGAGKSLLINALFDCDGLSLTGADGAACTSSVIEYVHYAGGRDSSGQQQFLAEIRFLSSKKQEEMIREHIRSYRHYHQDDDSDDESEEATSSKRKSLRQDEVDRRLKDTAEDVFCTLFGGREQFLEAWASCDYRMAEFVSTCQLKCKEAICSLDVNSENIATFIGKSAHDLLGKIKPFMTKIKDEVCLWPLVDRISIRFDSPLLEEGLVLIDLPGWGDINVSRARHADDIKDTVDVEFIVADTIRIGTDDTVINNARAAILNHGSAGVKLVATKIDSISPNQLAQCSGPGYDQIKNRIKETEEEANQAEEDDDTIRSDQLSKYKIYLERKLKQRKIEDRASDISKELALKLDGRDSEVKCFHVSSSDYMQWVSRPKIIYRDQPALPPELTGIPAIRRLLYHLPAEQNLQDLRKHVQSTVPAFLEKVKRVITEADRDVGFSNIADKFDQFRHDRIVNMVNECKEEFKRITDKNLEKAYNDPDIYKEQLDDMIEKSWISMKGPTFNKILKGRGTVLPGTSRARGLELGCDWNSEMSKILAPIFQKWYNAQCLSMKKVRLGVKDNQEALFDHVTAILKECPAGLNTIEKAKHKWNPYRHKLLVKANELLNAADARLKLILNRATMQDGRQNSLVASLTDDLFDDIFNSAPELKAGSTEKKKKYVTPKLRFQKNRMLELFIGPHHFADRAVNAFQKLVDEVMNEIIEVHMGSICKLLEGFSNTLRSQAPITYSITPIGEKIRSDLRDLLPKLDEQAKELCKFSPQSVKDEFEAEVPASEFSKMKSALNSLGYYLGATPEKRKREPNSRIKQEPGTKRLRLE